MQGVGFKDLQVVLERIAELPAPVMAEVKDVPKGKLGLMCFPKA
jgi:hypothetical protein